MRTGRLRQPGAAGVLLIALTFASIGLPSDEWARQRRRARQRLRRLAARRGAGDPLFVLRALVASAAERQNHLDL